MKPVARTIAVQLGETQRGPRDLITRIVAELGADVAQATANDAVALEADGGMLRADGVTRRTPGGIFFRLIQQRAPREVVRRIFPSAWDRKKARRARMAGGKDHQEPARVAPTVPPEPTLPAFVWAERQAVYPELRGQKGSVTSMKITLVGRPGRIVEKQDLVITMMQSMKAPGGFPKGVPAPPATPTTYVVYVSRKQWNKVADAIQNPDDALIIEGFAAFDPSLEGCGVYVTAITTKGLQAAKRQATPVAPSEG